MENTHQQHSISDGTSRTTVSEGQDGYERSGTEVLKHIQWIRRKVFGALGNVSDDLGTAREQTYLLARKSLISEEVYSTMTNVPRKHGTGVDQAVSERNRKILHEGMKIMLTVKDAEAPDRYERFRKVLEHDHNDHVEKIRSMGKIYSCTAAVVSMRDAFDRFIVLLEEYGVTRHTKEIYENFCHVVSHESDHETDVLYYVDRPLKYIDRKQYHPRLREEPVTSGIIFDAIREDGAGSTSGEEDKPDGAGGEHEDDRTEEEGGESKSEDDKDVISGDEENAEGGKREERRRGGRDGENSTSQEHPTPPKKTHFRVSTERVVHNDPPRTREHSFHRQSRDALLRLRGIDPDKRRGESEEGGRTEAEHREPSQGSMEREEQRVPSRKGKQKQSGKEKEGARRVSGEVQQEEKNQEE